MRTFAFALMAALLLPGTVSAQLEQTAGSNIRVTDCNPHRHTAAHVHPWIDPYGVWHSGPTDFPSYDAFLAIGYENRAAQTATEIDFGLVARGSLIAVAKDVGAFSTGAPIAHEFVVSREIFPLGTALPYCAVLRVKYADGSVWRNPSPPEP